MLVGDKVRVRGFGLQFLEFRGGSGSAENCVVALNGEEHHVSWSDLRDGTYAPPAGKPRAVDELWYPAVTDRLARLMPTIPELRYKFLMDLFLSEEDFQKLKKLTHAAAKAYGRSGLDDSYESIVDLTAELLAAWWLSGRLIHQRLAQ